MAWYYTQEDLAMASKELREKAVTPEKLNSTSSPQKKKVLQEYSGWITLGFVLLVSIAGVWYFLFGENWPKESPIDGGKVRYTQLLVLMGSGSIALMVAWWKGTKTTQQIEKAEVQIKQAKEQIKKAEEQISQSHIHQLLDMLTDLSNFSRVTAACSEIKSLYDRNALSNERKEFFVRTLESILTYITIKHRARPLNLKAVEINSDQLIAEKVASLWELLTHLGRTKLTPEFLHLVQLFDIPLQGSINSHGCFMGFKGDIFIKKKIKEKYEKEGEKGIKDLHFESFDNIKCLMTDETCTSCKVSKGVAKIFIH